MSEDADAPRPGDGGLPGEPGLPGRGDPRRRPDDPAGTKPKVEPETLLPAVRGSLLAPAALPAAPEPHGAGDVEPPPPRVEAPHGPRFQFVLGALVALGIAAVAAIALLVVNGLPERAPETPWSAWRPTGGDPAAQIALHVGQRYRQGNGEQLVNVDGGPLRINDTPLQIVLNQDGDYVPVRGDGVLYNLCGLGPNCRISSGKPSEERGYLLRREILELSLYTFKYTSADNVVAIMPPGVRPNGKPKKAQDQAVFIQREDVAASLDKPLGATLTAEPPRIGSVLTAPDFASVRAITAARSFNFRLQGAGVAGGYLILQPLRL